ncbi:DUF3021 domain-containing protein [Tuanshanicoccus lijuaniae]|uniref:DUF3021 domain-containing protein n=1 Tax=Aerococcaceae bacterium zg-1292 TaxID=2774330 RepID=UPI001BD87689|nr:DUF3021 domain-containing protein [Aerococcaceae bacterium zg-BR9]MBF6977817.1 DUF3021 domain-containing protein [Aerococcaceae bacterium zg-BR22]MBS4455967.1 DUF3021 domain-containing protein [Aerococcaceae bacterium zg-A91]MBS4457719.1 DUF3021 domain-containing protein [Aerococcaceae bacterium zg-BR33]
MKKIMMRCFIGGIIGVSIVFLIGLAVSVVIGDGNYYPVAPNAMNKFGSELNAALVQTLLAALLGSTYSTASLIYENTEYSLLKQTSMHFLFTTPIYLFVSYFMEWIGNNVLNLLIYLGIYVAIYLLIWILSYLSWKYNIKMLNLRIRQNAE